MQPCTPSAFKRFYSGALQPAKARYTQGLCGQLGPHVGADHSITLLNQMLWLVLTIAAPVVAAVMIVGLIISILQVATQLQEMTLNFIPKLLTAVLVMIAVAPWMIERMTRFAIEAIRLIPTVG